jgi:outer membrane receptor for ferrienterochelin and colicin
LLLFARANSFANENKEEKKTVLEDLVVSATLEDAKVLDTPGTVNIFTAEDIEKGGYTNVADVINGLPGITNSTTNPAMPKYNFRGTAYAHSRGATIYVDGREVNTGRIGYGDLSFVDINDVEQIQVIKTPGTQFAEPSRGVIYITTKRGKKDGHFQRLKGQYGSWGLHKRNISLRNIKIDRVMLTAMTQAPICVILMKTGWCLKPLAGINSVAVLLAIP